MVALRSIHDWVGEPGRVVSWHPSPASSAKMRDAPVSHVPVSYQQQQHIRTFRRRQAAGAGMARLNTPTWDMPGQCDQRAMSHVLNAYLRRHDTYHSRFELTADDEVVRHTLKSPRDLKFVPNDHGDMTAAQWRSHVLNTPDPLQWDCFTFGIIQRRDHFTFYISVDHVHTDALFMCVVLVEIHMMYLTLVNGGAPIALQEPGSYDDFCVKQRRYTAALTLESPEVKDWIAFAERNDGALPQFPLPLGDPSVPCGGDMIVTQLLDAKQSRRFDAVCTTEGVRFSGGVLACAALADHEFTGAPVFYGITPTTTRSTPAEFMTTGWFTGLVPFTVPVGAGSFGATARSAQASFDAGIDLAHVPFDRVLELADGRFGLRGAGPGVQMVSYLDAGLPPLSPAIIAEWERLNGKVYCDSRSADQVGMWVNRTERETVITVAFPDNPVARESVQRYLNVLKQIYARIAAEAENTRPAGHSRALSVRT
ncbi:condensation domain-containing protein [Mycobacterium sp. 236(2023)]|uniref:condensation domain-containing protein n=1 Tax=Mycobacterium sp. 236(2023) TaxID=3038163 RepID=UPI0024151065|nr:condensation domain-containing protein [Mycobacterium sp. 236(2023)]MDG4668993.1 condensation domain-containing protein [Mycobacterium sp. 236(2023)]